MLTINDQWKLLFELVLTIIDQWKLLFELVLTINDHQKLLFSLTVLNYSTKTITSFLQLLNPYYVSDLFRNNRKTYNTRQNRVEKVQIWHISWSNWHNIYSTILRFSDIVPLINVTSMYTTINWRWYIVNTIICLFSFLRTIIGRCSIR